MAREILVVDDDDAIRETVAEVLEEEGYRVTTTSNGGEAIAYLRRRGDEPPGLILLDLMMPVMNGLEFLESYAAETALPMVPVVVLSANPALSGRKHRKDVVLYLSKPIDRRRLLETVDLWCA
jgi:two-component system, chemotaxis family, chemotaxis protein CheY